MSSARERSRRATHGGSAAWSLLIGGILALALTPMAAGQAVTAASGHPDFQGLWVFDWLTPLERPPEAQGPTVGPHDSERLAQAIEARVEGVDELRIAVARKPLFQIDGAYRTSLIIQPADGRLPYTPAGRERLAKLLSAEAGPIDGPEARPPNERCLIAPGGGPYMPFPTQNFLRIVQTPTDLVLHMELMSSLRLIPLDGRPQPIGAMQQAASAEWDGDMLVIRSTGFRGPLRGARGNGSIFLVTPATRMTERFRRTVAEEVDYTFTVEDPALYMQPWTAEMIFVRSDQPTFESACHEGNYGLANILLGARRQEQRAAEVERPTMRRR